MITFLKDFEFFCALYQRVKFSCLFFSTKNVDYKIIFVLKLLKFNISFLMNSLYYNSKLNGILSLNFNEILDI